MTEDELDRLADKIAARLNRSSTHEYGDCLAVVKDKARRHAAEVAAQYGTFQPGRKPAA